MNKTFNTIFFIALVVGAFIYRDTIKNVWAQSINHYFPCKTTITYKIGVFDTEFGMSQADFLSAIKEAEAIWEKPLGKELFSHETSGSMKINLIYDVRQETTLQLKDMGIIVENNKASYDALKAKYDSLNAGYQNQKNIFETRLSAFEVRSKAYEAEVSSLNRKGGADKTTYARLNAEKEYLAQESLALNRMQGELNSAILGINTVAKALNELVATLNIGVKQYNTVGGSLGGEFDEGVYRSDAAGREIDIYQYDNRTKLIRVLAHELGHALGLGHVDDSKAIMYRLNNGINEKLTATDLSAVKALCGIK